MQIPFVGGLAYPQGRTPGMDPSHIAFMGGSPIFSAVCQGSAADFISMYPVPGAKGTRTGSLSLSVLSVGPALSAINGSATSTANVAFSSGQNTSIQTKTTQAAIIVTPATAPAARATFMTNTQNGAGNGQSFCISTNSFLLQMFDGNVFALVSSGITLASSTPYFVICSYKSNQQFWTAVNLLTGVIQQTTTAGSFVLTTAITSGPMLLNDTTTTSSNWRGFLAAAAITTGYLRPEAQRIWAADPWSFWYPSGPEQLLSLDLVGAQSAAQAALLAQTRAQFKSQFGPFTGTTKIQARAETQARATGVISTSAGIQALVSRAGEQIKARAAAATLTKYLFGRTSGPVVMGTPPVSYVSPTLDAGSVATQTTAGTATSVTVTTGGSNEYIFIDVTVVQTVSNSFTVTVAAVGGLSVWSNRYSVGNFQLGSDFYDLFRFYAVAANPGTYTIPVSTNISTAGFSVVGYAMANISTPPFDPNFSTSAQFAFNISGGAPTINGITTQIPGDTLLWQICTGTGSPATSIPSNFTTIGSTSQSLLLASTSQERIGYPLYNATFASGTLSNFLVVLDVLQGIPAGNIRSPTAATNLSGRPVAQIKSTSSITAVNNLRAILGRSASVFKMQAATTIVTNLSGLVETTSSKSRVTATVIMNLFSRANGASVKVRATVVSAVNLFGTANGVTAKARAAISSASSLFGRAVAQIKASPILSVTASAVALFGRVKVMIAFGIGRPFSSGFSGGFGPSPVQPTFTTAIASQIKSAVAARPTLTATAQGTIALLGRLAAMTQARAASPSLTVILRTIAKSQINLLTSPRSTAAIQSRAVSSATARLRTTATIALFSRAVSQATARSSIALTTVLLSRAASMVMARVASSGSIGLIGRITTALEARPIVKATQSLFGRATEIATAKAIATTVTNLFGRTATQIKSLSTVSVAMTLFGRAVAQIKSTSTITATAQTAVALISRLATMVQARAASSTTSSLFARTASQVKLQNAAAISTALLSRVNAAPAKARAAMTASTAFLGRVTTAVQARLAAPSGTLALLARTTVQVRAKLTPPGAQALFATAVSMILARLRAPTATVPLAGRMTLTTAASPQLTATRSLLGRTAVAIQARLTTNATTALSGLVKATAEARAAVTAAMSLLGRVAAQVKATPTLTAQTPLTAALNGLAKTMVTARSSAAALTAGLFSRAVTQFKLRLTPPGAQALFAAATSMFMARIGAARATLPLAGRITLTTTVQPGVTFTRSLLGRTAAVITARATQTRSALLSTLAAVATQARAQPTGKTSLLGRAKGPAVQAYAAVTASTALLGRTRTAVQARLATATRNIFLGSIATVSTAARLAAPRGTVVLFGRAAAHIKALPRLFTVGQLLAISPGRAAIAIQARASQLGFRSAVKQIIKQLVGAFYSIATTVSAVSTYTSVTTVTAITTVATSAPTYMSTTRVTAVGAYTSSTIVEN